MYILRGFLSKAGPEPLEMNTLRVGAGQSIINYKPTSPERILCQGGSSKNKKLQEKIKIG